MDGHTTLPGLGAMLLGIAGHAYTGATLHPASSRVRCVVDSTWDGTPRPRNKAALKAAKQHKAATRRAGKQ